MKDNIINSGKDADSDWQQGHRDCMEKKFPNQPGNQQYMQGWLNRLGMEVADANLPASFDELSFKCGYSIIQYKKHCIGDKTVISFVNITR